MTAFSPPCHPFTFNATILVSPDQLLTRLHSAMRACAACLPDTKAPSKVADVAMIATHIHAGCHLSIFLQAGGGPLIRLRQGDAICPQVLPFFHHLSPKPTPQLHPYPLLQFSIRDPLMQPDQWDGKLTVLPAGAYEGATVVGKNMLFTMPSLEPFQKKNRLLDGACICREIQACCASRGTIYRWSCCKFLP